MPVYTVRIDGHDYDVSADRELSDAEAYQYAQTQALQETNAPPSDEHSLKGFGQNVGRGIGEAAQGLGAMVTGAVTPIGDTAEAVASGVPGGLQVLRGMRAVKQAGGPLAVAGNVASDIIRRWSQPLESAYHEPLAMASDVATVGSGATGLLRGMSGPIARSAEWTIGKALKTPASILKRNNMTPAEMNRAALRVGTRVSPGGIEQDVATIAGKEAALGEVIDRSPATIRLTRQTMPETEATVRDQMRTGAANPENDLAAGRARRFLEHPNIARPVVDQQGQVMGYSPRDLSLRDVQRQKVELGKAAYDRGAQLSEPARDLGRSQYSDLRDQLVAAEPGIAPLSADLSPRYAVQEAKTARVPVHARRDIVPMAGAVGSVVAGGGGGRRLVAALTNMALTNPAVLSQAALTMDKAAQRVARLPKVAQTLAPYATMNTFAQTLAGETPTGVEAKTRGQIVTGAVQELIDRPEFAPLPIEQKDQAIAQLVDDVSLLVGGTADATRLKSRSSTILKNLMASHATERP